VTQLGTGVLGDVLFQFLPGVFVIADFVTMHANGQNALKCLDMRQGFLEFLHPLGQVLLPSQATTTSYPHLSKVIFSICREVGSSSAINIFMVLVFRGSMPQGGLARRLQHAHPHIARKIHLFSLSGRCLHGDMNKMIITQSY
jgi:hypothetical protein